MPVRLRITLLFTILVFIILGLVCGTAYSVSYKNRINNIILRLKNRAITTARLLSQSEIFDASLVQRIDEATTISLKNKAVQAYNYRNRRIYAFSDIPGDTINVDPQILNETRVKGDMYFTAGSKEVVSYHYADDNLRVVILAAAYDEDGKKYLSQLRNILVFCFLGGTIIAFISGYFFSERLLLPIRKIADEVNDISAQNFTTRIKTAGIKDEWYYLSQTLNQLLDRLQDSFELQRRFISNASHELSTPLTSISSQLEVTLQRERDAEAYRKVMQSVYQDVRNMGRLTQTLLEFAKASGSAAGIDINPVRIDEVLLRLPADMARQGKGFSVNLSFDELPADESQLLVFGNEDLLFTALRNIVVNACKYSSGHEAQVNLNVTPKAIEVVIKDEGVGISAEEVEKIFQPFYRVDESRTTEGFGLGLSLAQKIIKLHKGDIYVSSVLNKGTTFTISFPHT